MNLQEVFSKKELNLLKEVDTKIDNRDYSDVERKEMFNRVVDYIMSKSKNNT